MKRIILFFIFLGSIYLSNGAFAQPQGQGDALQNYVEAENLRKKRQWGPAIEAYNNALKKVDNNNNLQYQYYFGLANCYYGLKKVDECLAALDNVIKNNEKFVPAYLLKARVHKIQKLTDKVDEDYDLAFKYETDPSKKIDYKIRVMQHQAKAGRYDVAFQKIQEAKAVEPQNPHVNYFFSKLANQLGKYQEAKQALMSIEGEIGKLEPKDAAKYYFELGVAQFEMKEYKEANKSFEKANVPPFINKIKKYRPDYFCSIAMSYMKIHENETAMEYVNRALQIQESFAQAHVMAGQLAKRGKPSDEIQHLQNAVSHEADFPKKVVLFDKISALQLQSGDYQACLNTVNESLKIKNDDPDAWWIKTLALYKQGNNEECVKIIEDLLKRTAKKETQADLQFLAGMASKKISKWDRAKAGFYRALQSSHRNASEIEMTEVERTVGQEKKK